MATAAHGATRDGTHWRRGTVAYAMAIQAGLLLLTAFVIVVAPAMREEPEFSPGRTIYLPQKELEHRVAVSEFQQTVAQPLQLEKLVTSALLPPELPALPTVPRTEYTPVDPVEALARDAQALLAQAGFSGNFGKFKSAASAAAFFGIEDSGERIVLAVNTSVSVRNKAQRRGVSWEHIQQEVIALLGRLAPGTQFALVQFSQGVRTFPEQLAAATANNRAAAEKWIERHLRGNPPVSGEQLWFGHEAAFEAAFRFDPDVIFLVTDGVLDRREERGGRTAYPTISYETLAGSMRRFQQKASRETRIHVVGFEMGRIAAEAMSRLARAHGGQVRAF